MQQSFQFFQCTPLHLNEILLLQAEVYDSLDNKSVLRLNTPEMLLSCLQPPHITLGVRCGNKLAAFGILYIPQTESEDLSHDLPFQVNVASANQKLFIVNKLYRGQGLQSTLISLLEVEAKKRGIGLLCCTCSPDNTFSINNFINSGYIFACTLLKYGGLQRNLYYKYI